MANSIAFVRNYTAVIDEVYQRAVVSGCLNSPRRMARAGRNAREIMIPKIEVTGLDDYTRNVGYKTGSITYEFETKTFNYDRGTRLLADVMDVVEAGSELQRVQVAPEADAFTFAEIAGHAGVESAEADYADADAQVRAGRLQPGEPGAQQPRAHAVLAHRGGAAGGVLDGCPPVHRGQGSSDAF